VISKKRSAAPLTGPVLLLNFHFSKDFGLKLLNLMLYNRNTSNWLGWSRPMFFVSGMQKIKLALHKRLHFFKGLLNHLCTTAERECKKKSQNDKLKHS